MVGVAGELAEELELLLEEKDYLKYLKKKYPYLSKTINICQNKRIDFIVKIPGWSQPPWKDAGGEKREMLQNI